MDARTLDTAAARLRELRAETRQELALAAVSLALSLVATGVFPALALPLFLGGLFVGARGVRAMWRHWDLVDALATKPEALAIPEVLAHAAREATLERRRLYAEMIRGMLGRPELPQAERIVAAFEELEALASELDDPELELDPACAVCCMRLAGDLVGSPLLNPEVPPEELSRQVRRIRAGFHPKQLTQDASASRRPPGMRAPAA
jgi:hypothetical protein